MDRVGASGWFSVRETAQILGVSERRVQALAREGQIHTPARGVYDVWSVRAFQVRRQGAHTQGWAARTAWAAVALLSGEAVTWIGQPQRSRVATRLRQMSATEVVAASRNRALVGHFEAHPAALSRLDGDPRTVSCRVLPQLVRIGEGRQWYVIKEQEAGVVRDYGLRPSPAGEVVLRAADAHPELGYAHITLGVLERLVQGPALAALDASTSEDPRESGLGLRTLDELLTRFRQS